MLSCFYLLHSINSPGTCIISAFSQPEKYLSFDIAPTRLLQSILQSVQHLRSLMDTNDFCFTASFTWTIRIEILCHSDIYKEIHNRFS
jgi:hypothetical protein